MKQEPVVEQLLPLKAETIKADENQHSWDYIYEPDAQSVIDELLVRYVESLIYQAVAENMASEHSARMVAMKAATDNAGNVINELKLVYNKTRQAAITKRNFPRSCRGCGHRRLINGRYCRIKLIGQNMAQAQGKIVQSSAPWWTWSFRAIRCRRSMTPEARKVRH